MASCRRRSVLNGLGVFIAGGVVGCLRTPSGEPTREVKTPQANAPTPRPPRNGTATPESAGPVRCEGDPVSTKRSITDHPGYDDEIEYFRSNRTIRFVAASSRGEPARFDTWSFAEWGRLTTAKVGLDRVREVTADRLGTRDFVSGMGRPPAGAATKSAVIWVHIGTKLDRDGDVISTPAVPFSDLVESAPRSADVTVSLEGDSFSRVVPVFADTGTTQLV